MAIVNLSLDTNSRQVVLTINGIQVPTQDCCLQQYMYDGEKDINFYYTIETVNPDGMQERRQFSLPTQDVVASLKDGELNEDGMVSKECPDDEHTAAGLIDIIKPKRKNK